MHSAPVRPILRFLNVELDLSRVELRLDGQRVHLEKLPLDLLILLAARPGVLVTRQEIVDALWGPDVFVDSEQGINTAVRKIRKALHDPQDTPRLIETVVGRGYRFLPVVEQTTGDGRQQSGNGLTAWISSGPKRWRLVTTVALVLAAVSATVWIVGGRMASSRPIQSIAVLPFDDLGWQGSEPYFADGLTDALITTLARTGRVRVISRTSILQFRRPHPPLPEISGQLGVEAFVEGTVQRSGNRVRVTARLIEAKTDRHLWARSYERSVGDLLLLQDELGRDISAEIGHALHPHPGSTPPASTNLAAEAIDLYLRGRFQWAKRTESGLTESLTLFRRTLDLEPSFPKAYSGLADAYASLGYLGYLGPVDSFEPAEAAARQALDIDPTLAEARASLGFVQLYYRWNWLKAEDEFDRAIRFNPGYAPAYQWQGVYLAAMGRLPEAAAVIEQARHLDPLSLAVATDIGWQQYLGRDYQAAGAQLSAVTIVDRKFPLAHFWLGRTLTEQGRHDDAIRELSMAAELLNRSPVSLVQLAHAQAVAGHPDRARELLAELKETSHRRHVPAYGIALIHVGLGEYENAFPWLARAIDERSNWLVWLNLDPRWDPIRQDARFVAIVRRIGLP